MTNQLKKETVLLDPSTPPARLRAGEREIGPLLALLV